MATFEGQAFYHQSIRLTDYLHGLNMSRSSTRSDRLANKGRPKRRAAAKTHFFKYQQASNPSRALENDLKRALQESLLEEQQQDLASVRRKTLAGNSKQQIISSTNSSDVSKGSNQTSTSNESVGFIISSSHKRTRSSNSSNSPQNTNPANLKRAKLANGHQSKCDGISFNQNKSPASTTTTTTTSVSTGTNTIISRPATESPQNNRAIKTYSRNHLNSNRSGNKLQFTNGPNSSTPIHEKHPTGTAADPILIGSPTNSVDNQSKVSKSTQTPSVKGKPAGLSSILKKDTRTDSRTTCDNDCTSLDLGNNTQKPAQDQYLKFKRESKNYAYVKMTALKVSTSKSPSSNSKSTNSKKSSPNGVLNSSKTNKDMTDRNNVTSKIHFGNGTNSITKHLKNGINNTLNTTNLSKINSNKHDNKSVTKHDATTGELRSVNISNSTTPNSQQTKTSADKSKILSNKNQKIVQGSQRNNINNSPHHRRQDVDIYQDIDRNLKLDCLIVLDDTIELSNNIDQAANIKVAKKRSFQGSWSLLGVPEEKVIYLRDDEPPRRLICYPAIKHVEGDVIQVRDSVLLRSGAKKNDLPFIAKVCAFWEDAETGGVMMSLFWYYRPEHTEEGRKEHHLSDEIFASRHRDVDSVECIEDKCYVLTFNEYCRYRKRCKMEQVNTTWSLADVTIPVSNESYPRRNRIPDGDVNPELVFCCRQIYDSRMKRLVKNPLINPKYGHI